MDHREEGFSFEQGIDPSTDSAPLASSAAAPETSTATTAAGVSTNNNNNAETSSAPSAAGNPVGQSTNRRMMCSYSSIEPRAIVSCGGVPGSSGGSSCSALSPAGFGRPPHADQTSQPSGANGRARPTVRRPVRTPALPQGRNRRTQRELDQPVVTDRGTGYNIYLPVAELSIFFYQSLQIGPMFQPYGPNMMVAATHLPLWMPPPQPPLYLPQWQSPFFSQFPPVGPAFQTSENIMIAGVTYLQPAIHGQSWVNPVHTVRETRIMYDCYQLTVEQGVFPDWISQVDSVLWPGEVRETMTADYRRRTNASTLPLLPQRSDDQIRRDQVESVEHTSGSNRYWLDEESSTSEESTASEIGFPSNVIEPR